MFSGFLPPSLLLAPISFLVSSILLLVIVLFGKAGFIGIEEEGCLLLLLTPDLAIRSFVLLVFGAAVLFKESDLAVDLDVLFSFEVAPGGALLFFRTAANAIKN